MTERNLHDIQNCHPLLNSICSGLCKIYHITDYTKLSVTTMSQCTYKTNADLNFMHPLHCLAALETCYLLTVTEWIITISMEKSETSAVHSTTVGQAHVYCLQVPVADLNTPATICSPSYSNQLQTDYQVWKTTHGSQNYLKLRQWTTSLEWSDLDFSACLAVCMQLNTTFVPYLTSLLIPGLAKVKPVPPTAFKVQNSGYQW